VPCVLEQSGAIANAANAPHRGAHAIPGLAIEDPTARATGVCVDQCAEKINSLQTPLAR
jgi:hypothetical protein